MFRRIANALFGTGPATRRSRDERRNGSDIDELLSESNDFDLTEGVLCLIIRPHGAQWFDVSLYTPLERPIVLVSHASEIIDHGGFESLFRADWDGDPYYTQTLEAHRRLQLAPQVIAFEKALSAFPESTPPESERYMTVPEEVRHETNRLYRGNDGGTPEKQIAQYIRDNRPQFAYLQDRLA